MFGWIDSKCFSVSLFALCLYVFICLCMHIFTHTYICHIYINNSHTVIFITVLIYFSALFNSSPRETAVYIFVQICGNSSSTSLTQINLSTLFISEHQLCSETGKKPYRRSHPDSGCS